MRIATPSTRLRETIAFWALAGVALLVAHDAIFATQMGPGAALAQALRSAGHGYWGAASALILVIALVAALVGGARLLRLRGRAAALHATPVAAPDLAARALGAWSRLFLLVAVAFVIQENVEHLVSHGHLIGTGALLGPEYPLALPVIAAITGLAALVAALIARTERALVEAIDAALNRMALRPRRSLGHPPLHAVLPLPPVLARSGAGRAPPPLLPSVTNR